VVVIAREMLYKQARRGKWIHTYKVWLIGSVLVCHLVGNKMSCSLKYNEWQLLCI
jgi:hypothetical protein